MIFPLVLFLLVYKALRVHVESAILDSSRSLGMLPVDPNLTSRGTNECRTLRVFYRDGLSL